MVVVLTLSLGEKDSVCVALIQDDDLSLVLSCHPGNLVILVMLFCCLPSKYSKRCLFHLNTAQENLQSIHFPPPFYENTLSNPDSNMALSVVC